MAHYEKIGDLLDNLLTCSMAEASRRVGISERLPWHWLVQSRLGHPELQEVEFCGVVAPFHVQVQNAKALTAQQIEQSALERARDGCLVDVFFQGVRQFERVIKPEFAGKSDDELALIVGPEWEKECYEMRPTKQWLKPSDQLVIKMVESWNRKRYGAHQSIDVNYGGVLRLEKEPTNKPAIESKSAEVFEEAPDDNPEQRGGHLALAAPAKSSAEFEARAAAGEFDQAPVTFRDADGKPAALRADIQALRLQAEELKKNGPKVRQPSHRVEINPADEPDKAVVAQDRAPEAPDIRDHRRAYYVPTPQPPRPRPSYSQDEASVGTGREGVGVGPDPRKIGSHVGFPVR
jgi:hypothetical protein